MRGSTTGRIIWVAVFAMAMGIGGSREAFGASPSITAISVLPPTLAHGSTVTITGTGFGTKTTAAPFLWADFESSIQPTSLGTKTAWDNYNSVTDLVGNIGWSTDCASITPGTHCAKANDGNGSWAIRVDSTSPYWNLENQQVYIYRLVKKNFLITDNSQNYKIWRMWPSPANYPNIYSAENNDITNVELSSSGDSPFYAPSGNLQTRSTDWVIQEIIFQASSAPNTADGRVTIRYNGVDRTGPSNALNTRGTALDSYMQQNYVVHDVVANPGSWTPAWDAVNNRSWADDVYVDTTWARVMLCDKSTYAACTKLAPQIPSSWTNTSITMTFNLGPLYKIGSRYLYVVDSSGNVNSSGFNVSVLPSAPTGLTLQ